MDEYTLVLFRRGGGQELALWVSLRGKCWHPLQGKWRLVLATEDERFSGAGNEVLREAVARGEVLMDGPQAALLERES